ncbi:MAG: hypothetical protein LLG14_12630 [Nocardiaceae bacterium]|nr:hypothetical protein [Nocardiaceae bacterium]
MRAPVLKFKRGQAEVVVDQVLDRQLQNEQRRRRQQGLRCFYGSWFDLHAEVLAVFGPMSVRLARFMEATSDSWRERVTFLVNSELRDEVLLATRELFEVTAGRQLNGKPDVWNPDDELMFEHVLRLVGPLMRPLDAALAVEERTSEKVLHKLELLLRALDRQPQRFTQILDRWDAARAHTKTMKEQMNVSDY